MSTHSELFSHFRIIQPPRQGDAPSARTVYATIAASPALTPRQRRASPEKTTGRARSVVAHTTRHNSGWNHSSDLDLPESPARSVADVCSMDAWEAATVEWTSR